MATAQETIDRYYASLYGFGIKYKPVGQTIIDEVERMGPDGLYLSTACALIEKESHGRNVFGCDHGATWTLEPPYCNVEVTPARVKGLLINIGNGGGANGVGLTQLTTPSLVREADALPGGAAEPRNQCRIGFRYLNDLIAQYGWQGGAAAYNAGPGNRMLVYHTYGADLVRLEREWASRLEGATSAPTKKALLKPKEGTHFYLGYSYTRPLIGNRDYWFWTDGEVPSGEGMYAINRSLPPVERIKKINCAGYTNLYFRAMRKRIPTLGNRLYDGGVAAYAGGYYGPGYFHNQMVKFDLEKAKKWARDTRCGVLLLRPYWNPTISGQGHVAILLPSGYVSQSFSNPWGADLNEDFTIEQSHGASSGAGYYTHMVHPRQWSESNCDTY